jgi:hypothetical protein
MAELGCGREFGFGEEGEECYRGRGTVTGEACLMGRCLGGAWGFVLWGLGNGGLGGIEGCMVRIIPLHNVIFILLIVVRAYEFEGSYSVDGAEPGDIFRISKFKF